jgi:predicted nucleic acid-binding protein
VPAAFLDTNILLRHLLQDDPRQSSRCTSYLGRIERGEVRARIANTVVFEAVFVLQRQHAVPRSEIRDALLALIELPGIVLPGKRMFGDVFDLYVERNVSFIDAYHAVLARRLGLNEIVSYDRGLDRVPGIRRVEPE